MPGFLFCEPSIFLQFIISINQYDFITLYYFAECFKRSRFAYILGKRLISLWQSNETSDNRDFGAKNPVPGSQSKKHQSASVG